MLTVRKSAERGPTKISWLDSKHSFSFGSYRDPKHTGFRDLLVINEDRVAPGGGFGRHGHADMEIISYVLEGALGHKDSTGTDGIILPGEIQLMSAGAGIEHSEMNASASDPVHFLQIWIKPNKRGIAPAYEQVVMPSVTADAQLDLIAGPAGGKGAVTLHANATVHRAILDPGATLEVAIPAGYHSWVQVVRGDVTVNGQPLATGDGLAISNEQSLKLTGGNEATELLLFDLA